MKRKLERFCTFGGEGESGSRLAVFGKRSYGRKLEGGKMEGELADFALSRARAACGVDAKAERSQKRGHRQEIITHRLYNTRTGVDATGSADSPDRIE